MKKVIGVFSAAVLVLALQTPARALDVRLGVNANYGTENNFGVGPRLELDFNEYVPGLRVAGDFHKFFDPDEVRASLFVSGTTNLHLDITSLVVGTVITDSLAARTQTGHRDPHPQHKILFPAVYFSREDTIVGH